MIPSSPGLGKVRVALGEEAWYRSFGLLGVQSEARGKGRYEPHCSHGMRLPGGHRIPHLPATALATTFPTFLPPGELQAGLQAVPFPSGLGKLLTLPSPAHPSAHQEES